MKTPSAGWRMRRGLTSTGLVVLGLAGLLVVAWYVVSFLTGARIVVFMTGSMSPELPTGSAAISVPVAATELEIGDVVTLQRDDATLPVTHRITRIEQGPPGAGDGVRSLTLQGDDNPVPDQFPYVVDAAHRMVVGAPHVGAVLEDLRSPWVIMGLTAVVAALVFSVFWPDPDDDAADSPSGSTEALSEPTV
ncbi:signal peptidase I [Citricoccus zhacaiensis]|nr:signal peptidase I [Citricoccus zhacaiensis]